MRKNRHKIVYTLFLILSFLTVIQGASGIAFAEDNAPKNVEEAKERQKEWENPKKEETRNPNDNITLEEAEKKAKEAEEEERIKEKKGESYEKVDEKQGGITLKGKEYPLATYQGHSTGGKLEDGILSLGNGIFWLVKLIYSGVDEGLNLIASQELIKDNAKLVSGVASTLWNELSSVYGIILIAIAGMCAFFLMAIRGDVVNGIQTIFKVILVFVLGSLFLMKADTVIETLDDVSAELQGTVLKVGKVFQSDYKEIPEGLERDGTVAILRNVWFDITVYRPYLVMNYGTVDEQAINHDDPERIESLIQMKKSEKNEKALTGKIESEANEENNSFMDYKGDGVFSKLGISIFSLIVVIALGIPFLTLALANLIIQFAVLGIILILPFSLLMSLLPNYGNSGYKLIGKLVVCFLAKGMIALFVLFIVLAVTIVDASVSLSRTQADVPLDNPIGRYILHTLTLVIILNVLISQRNKILSMISGGRIQMGGQEATVKRGMGGMMMSGALLASMARKLGNKGKKGLNKVGNSEPVRKRRGQINNTFRKSMASMGNKFSPKRQLSPQTAGTGTNGSNVVPMKRRNGGNGTNQRNRPNRPTTNNKFSPKRQLKNTIARNQTSSSRLSPKRQLRTTKQPPTKAGNQFSQKRKINVSETPPKGIKKRLKIAKNGSSTFANRRPKTSENAK